MTDGFQRLDLRLNILSRGQFLGQSLCDGGTYPRPLKRQFSQILVDVSRGVATATTALSGFRQQTILE